MKTTIFIDESGTLPDTKDKFIVMTALASYVGSLTRKKVLENIAKKNVKIYTLIIDKMHRKIADTPKNYSKLLKALIRLILPKDPASTIHIDKHFNSELKAETLQNEIKKDFPQVDSRIDLADFIQNMRILSKLLFLTLILLFTYPELTYAQSEGLNATPAYSVTDKDAVDGDILVFTPDGLKRTDIPSAENIFGVLDKQALVTIETGEENEQPITTSGTALVNVVNTNGQIKKGDRITTSAAPGKGQKLATSGYSLGIALGDLASGDVGQIPVAIRIEYFGTSSGKAAASIFSALGASVFQNVQDPKNLGQILRYLAAGLSVVSGFVISFFIFSKSVPKSIDAVGRNPLAQKSIYTVVWMNVLLAVLTASIGAIAAILIIKL